ncbi:MAG TPA: TIGR00159 family protein [Candidatus Fimivivens faecavium]|nr:TIGR00159 family protein [Candidatus Fimivivens faecavium]
MTLLLSDLTGILRSIHINDILDIMLVAYLIYQAFALIRETRALQLLKGILALIALYVMSHLLNLKAMTFIMRNILQFGALALLVVFQPELRRALEQVGRTRFSNFQLLGSNDSDEDILSWNLMIKAVGEAATYLSKRKIGALMVFERQTKLGEIIKTGTIIDASPSAEMIGNIFFPNSPLHDGATIIRNGKLYAAGCFLPLSDNFEISKDLGTRHRAALGMSENSDAVIVVVSEETGVITMVQDGKFKRGYTGETVMAELSAIFTPEKKEAKSFRKPPFLKGKKNEQQQ